MLYGKAPRFVRIKMNLTTIGIDWVNTIYEDFLFVTVRSIVSHLIILILLFVLVHSEQDLYFYALLTVMTNGIVYVSNLFYCKKYVKISLTKVHNARKHLKPMLALFANKLAMTIYVDADATMLGQGLLQYLKK